MADILAEFFDQFCPEEQAQIMAAEAEANGFLAQGDAGVRNQMRLAGSLSDRDSILEPQDSARANAACAVFVAYHNVLWNKTDSGSGGSIKEFLARLDRVCEGVLTRYGRWEGKDAIAELRSAAERFVWSIHAKRLVSRKVEGPKPAEAEQGTAAVVPNAPGTTPAVPNVISDENGRQPADTQLDHAKTAKESRAMTVARIINELNGLKPQMFEDHSEYNRLREQYPDYLTFKIAETRPDLKQKVLSIRSSPRHVRLAQELAAAYHGRELSTIRDDWKDHKPPEFKRRP
jgi:hypothetical protein